MTKRFFTERLCATYKMFRFFLSSQQLYDIWWARRASVTLSSSIATLVHLSIVLLEGKNLVH